MSRAAAPGYPAGLRAAGRGSAQAAPLRQRRPTETAGASALHPDREPRWRPRRGAPRRPRRPDRPGARGARALGGNRHSGAATPLRLLEDDVEFDRTARSELPPDCFAPGHLEVEVEHRRHTMQRLRDIQKVVPAIVSVEAVSPAGRRSHANTNVRDRVFVLVNYVALDPP